MTRSTYAAAIIAAVILSFCFSTPCQAAVPDSLNFQGYLTDPAGSPIDADTQITFSIYNVETSGVPRWSEIRVVEVLRGLFSVELGGATSPFPLDLFDDPLWLGVQVEGDPEMAPRRPITAVGFAFRADDADTLQGLTPSSLDQSDHVADVDNPHGVTATQVGAAASADLVNVEGDVLALQAAASALQTDLAAANVAVTTLQADMVNANTTISLLDAGLASANTTILLVQGDLDLVGSGLSTLQGNSVLALDGLLTFTDNTALFTGTNVQVVSGSGSTTGTVNGLGNLIVGYDEARAIGDEICSLGAYDNQGDCETNGGTWALSHKTGSHNLVVGQGNSYSSYGGLLAGSYNTVNAVNASVSGGYLNTASGGQSSVSGGYLNTASGGQSSVSGGASNVASGQLASVSGGDTNTASGNWSSVSGGWLNVASGVDASILGGYGNEAFGQDSSVSGGNSNFAGGFWSSVTGGQNNTATGNYTSVTGGSGLTATDPDASLGGSGPAGQGCPPGQALRGFDAQGEPLCVQLPGLPGTFTVDATGAYWPSIAIGSDGLPVISYVRDAVVAHEYELVVAHCDDVACTSVTLTPVDAPDAGVPSIAIGADGLPVVSYHVSSFGPLSELRVAHCDNTACTSATVTVVDSLMDPVAWIRHSSIAIGTDGFPIISYREENNNKLKVAHCDNATCTNATVTTLGTADFDEGTSIAVGSDGLPVISYYRHFSFPSPLHLAHCDNVACTSAIKTPVSDGTGSSMAIGTDGFPVISYFGVQSGREQLQVADCHDAACTSVTLVGVLDFESGNHGYSSAIAIGTDGFPVISFVHNFQQDRHSHLEVVDCDAACASPRKFTVDTGDEYGFSTSIAISTDGFPIISYDPHLGPLKVARVVAGF